MQQSTFARFTANTFSIENFIIDFCCFRVVIVTDNNVRRTNAGEEGLWETKNNAFGLAIEDRGRQYQLRRTKDVRPGQV